MKSRLLITTSREPSRRTRSFIKDLSIVLPNSVRVTRGKSTHAELAGKAFSLSAYGILVVLEKKGNPSALLFAEPTGPELKKVFLLKLGGVSLLRELPGSQLPLGVEKLVIVPKTIPRGFAEILAPYIVECFRPTIVEKAVGRVLEIKLLGGEKEALVAFICASSDRECGPRFKVIRIVDYVKQVRLPE
ncbi:MAG: hypothetical protein QW154_00425 [Sulfolobales archaeon]